MQHGLEREELKLDYQPCMDMPKLKVVGVEASISWDHPRLGKISATDFLPLAKDTGLITSIDEWVMRTACQQVRQWQNKGLSLSLAVNLSSQTFRQDHFVSLVTTILRQTKLNPKYLELQLTEKAMGKNLEIAMVKMRQLQPLGVKLSNNCGKGCSTLGSLQFLNL